MIACPTPSLNQNCFEFRIKDTGPLMEQGMGSPGQREETSGSTSNAPRDSANTESVVNHLVQTTTTDGLFGAPADEQGNAGSSAVSGCIPSELSDSRGPSSVCGGAPQVSAHPLQESESGTSCASHRYPTRTTRQASQRGDEVASAPPPPRQHETAPSQPTSPPKSVTERDHGRTQLQIEPLIVRHDPVEPPLGAAASKGRVGAQPANAFAAAAARIAAMAQQRTCGGRVVRLSQVGGTAGEPVAPARERDRAAAVPSPACPTSVDSSPEPAQKLVHALEWWLEQPSQHTEACAVALATSAHVAGCESGSKPSMAEALPPSGQVLSPQTEQMLQHLLHSCPHQEDVIADQRRKGPLAMAAAGPPAAAPVSWDMSDKENSVEPSRACSAHPVFAMAEQQLTTSPSSELPLGAFSAAGQAACLGGAPPTCEESAAPAACEVASPLLPDTAQLSTQNGGRQAARTTLEAAVIAVEAAVEHVAGFSSPTSQKWKEPLFARLQAALSHHQLATGLAAGGAGTGRAEEAGAACAVAAETADVVKPGNASGMSADCAPTSAQGQDAEEQASRPEAPRSFRLASAEAHAAPSVPQAAMQTADCPGDRLACLQSTLRAPKKIRQTLPGCEHLTAGGPTAKCMR